MARLIWSTTHHDQSSHHIWELLDQSSQTDKVKIYWNCMKRLMSHNSYKYCQIKIEGYYDQLHIMTNHPIKYESYRTNDLRGVALTKWSRTDKRENYMPPNYCSWRQLICLVQWWMMVSFEWLLSNGKWTNFQLYHGGTS